MKDAILLFVVARGTIFSQLISRLISSIECSCKILYLCLCYLMTVKTRACNKFWLFVTLLCIILSYLLYINLFIVKNLLCISCNKVNQ